MQFGQDLVSDFIQYKLNNPQALEKEMKLIEDRKECMRRLQEYGRQMENLKNDLTSHNNILDTLTARRAYLQQNFHREIQQLDAEIAHSKQKIDQLKRQTHEKQNSSGQYLRSFEQFQNDMVISKQKLIEDHDEQLTMLDAETEQLRKLKEEKKLRKVMMQDQLKKLKDRQKIISNTLENVEKVRGKWNTRQSQLDSAKTQYESKQKEVDEMIHYSKSMEKVIYANLYKRITDTVNQMTAALTSLYQLQALQSNKPGLEQHLERMFAHLKDQRQRLVAMVKQKRDRYRTNSSLPERDAFQYNYIVETKINPELLSRLQPSKYIIDYKTYQEIEEGQNNMLDSLQLQKVESQRLRESYETEIKSLERRIAEFEQQIEIKRRSILSPGKKKK